MYGYGFMIMVIWRRRYECDYMVMCVGVWFNGHVHMVMEVWLWLYGYGVMVMVLWSCCYGYGVTVMTLCA